LVGGLIESGCDSLLDQFGETELHHRLMSAQTRKF